MKKYFRHLQDHLELDLASYTARTDLQHFRVEAFKANVFKKYLDNVSPQADALALEKFEQANEACRTWELVCDSMLDEYLIGEFRKEIYQFWYHTGVDGLASSVFDFYEFAKVGPGSVIGANGFDHYSKLYASQLTVTSNYLYQVYRRCADNGPITHLAEKARFADYGPPRVTVGSRLVFVPKRDDISRTICIEPNLNMFFQKGFEHILLSRLEQVYKIRLASQQDKNRLLAKIGSIDGSYSTIDLSSASDSISIRMLEATFPKPWVDLLKQLRSPKVLLPDGRTLDLYMISSMGNATTFPLETIIFRAVVAACLTIHNCKTVRSKVAVFGDDIIVPTEIYPKVIRLLHLLGFTVNSSKTFVEGPFRESCGHDYYLGHDVRPVFIKRLRSVQDRYVAINLLIAWSAKCNVPLHNAVRYLLSTVEKRYIPPNENFDAGILIPYNCLKKVSFDQNGSNKYRASRPILIPLRINCEKRILRGPKSKKLTWNPAGILDTFLRGYVKDYLIPVRQDRVRYSTKTGITPYWDYLPADSSLGGVLNLLYGDKALRRCWNDTATFTLFLS